MVALFGPVDATLDCGSGLGPDVQPVGDERGALVGERVGDRVQYAAGWAGARHSAGVDAAVVPGEVTVADEGGGDRYREAAAEVVVAAAGAADGVCAGAGLE